MKTKDMMDSLKSSVEIEKFKNIVDKVKTYEKNEKYYQFKNYLTEGLIEKKYCGKITKIKI